MRCRNETFNLLQFRCHWNESNIYIKQCGDVDVDDTLSWLWLGGDLQLSDFIFHSNLQSFWRLDFEICSLVVGEKPINPGRDSSVVCTLSVIMIESHKSSCDNVNTHKSIFLPARHCNAIFSYPFAADNTFCEVIGEHKRSVDISEILLTK